MLDVDAVIEGCLGKMFWPKRCDAKCHCHGVDTEQLITTRHIWSLRIQLFSFLQPCTLPCQLQRECLGQSTSDLNNCEPNLQYKKFHWAFHCTQLERGKSGGNESRCRKQCRKRMQAVTNGSSSRGVAHRHILYPAQGSSSVAMVPNISQLRPL